MSQAIAQTSPKLMAILLPSLEYQNYRHEPPSHQFLIMYVWCVQIHVYGGQSGWQVSSIALHLTVWIGSLSH